MASKATSDPIQRPVAGPAENYPATADGSGAKWHPPKWLQIGVLVFLGVGAACMVATTANSLWSARKNQRAIGCGASPEEVDELRPARNVSAAYNVPAPVQNAPAPVPVRNPVATQQPHRVVIPDAHPILPSPDPPAPPPPPAEDQTLRVTEEDETEI